MGKVLLGWEMGLGIGYAVRLLAIARTLAAAGHAPVLAFRDMEKTWSLSIDDPFPVVQAPMVVGRLDPEASRNGFHPTGFADLLACNGFGSFDHLIGSLQSWCGIIDAVKPRPDRGRILPAAGAGGLRPNSGGSGQPCLFDAAGRCRHLSPIDAAAPGLRGSNNDAGAGQRSAAPAGAIRSWNASRPSTGAPPRFILTLPELDPYRAVRRDPVSGPLERLPDLSPVPAAPRFYAYLAGKSPGCGESGAWAGGVRTAGRNLPSGHQLCLRCRRSGAARDRALARSFTIGGRGRARIGRGQPREYQHGAEQQSAPGGRKC